MSIISKLKRGWLVFFLGVISATGPLSLDMYLPSLPKMQTYFHTSAANLQLSITFCLFGLAVGQLFIGPLSDQWGRKIPLIIGFSVYAITSILLSVTNNIVWFILIRFIQGLAGSAGQVISRAIARDLFNGKALTKFYAMLMAVNGLFPIISPIIGGYVLNYFEWQMIFVILAIIGCLITVATIFGLSETRNAKKVSMKLINTFKNQIALVKHPKFILMALSQGFIFGALFSYISSSSFVFQNIFHMTVTQFSILYAINGLGIILGNNFPSWVEERISDIDIMKVGLTLVTFAGILLVSSQLFEPMAIMVIMPLFMAVFGIGIVNTIATSLAMNAESKQNAGSASAVLGLLMNIFGAIAAPLSSLLGEYSYWPLATLILAFGVLGFITFRAYERVK